MIATYNSPHIAHNDLSTDIYYPFPSKEEKRWRTEGLK
jgi:hypothetical protein